ncbi:D-alanyl-D-alanine carboxypeptidase [Bizionia echini]|uniref:D-alanyl-D-alanine carboxypeptidase n=1 Tax=Bizionia echini TaxID=649333 RepID=A0A1I5BPQ2_9FLAO|nr:serine hydrolase domain-containing protein [Bizionia echini]SFN76639.1 D-alanyl-D-alanine carboxypeptidase [Bizionia echini]
MKKIFKPILLGFLFLPSLVYTQSIETKFQAIIDSVYASNQTSIGIMVSVESPERNISWSGAIGYSNLTPKTKLEPDQPALIASNTKTYVSATILKLVENGKLSINQPIKDLLTARTSHLFIQGGYNVDAIQVKHLLSHTSGIVDYANQAYMDFINANKTYRWTRDEQLEWAINIGPPLGKPETVFSYSDTNYLLLTEIIENITKQSFYTAMRALLQYESLGFNNTWFPTLEDQPEGTKPLAHQYWQEYNWNSTKLDNSVDLFGGGGIACTTHDLASFAYKLFNNSIIKDTSVLNLIYTKIPIKNSEPSHYYFGLSAYTYNGLHAYGHGGFWGTRVLYFPKLKTSIAVYVLERDKRGLINEIIEDMIGLLNN